MLAFSYASRHGLSLFRCTVASTLGFYCPGCGGSRAASALLHGRVLSSLRLYPPIPIAAACLALSDLRMALFLLGKGRFPSRRFGYGCMILCVLSILLQFATKNILLLYGIDVLGDIL